LIWRNVSKEIGGIEAPEHYIDWTEAHERIFGSTKNLPLDFSEYREKMGKDFKLSLGVAPYRIRGFEKRCKKFAENLNVENQGKLLECIGVLSHYTGDLSMPLHTTDNYDGQKSGQRGVHSFFENELVNALDPQLKVEVYERAKDAFDKSPATKFDGDGAVRWLIAQSHAKIDELLSMDKKLDRSDLAMAKEKFHNMIVEQLVQGAIVTAVVWSEILVGVDHFDENKFYFFDGTPEYVFPGKEADESKVFAHKQRD